VTDKELRGATRILERIGSLGLRCLDCFEQLTLTERLQDRSYCTNCFPSEMEEEVDE